MNYHPSNVLYRGEAEDFEHAMNLVIAQCDTELVNARASAPDEFMSEREITRLIGELEAYKKAAQVALDYYNKAIQAGGDEETARIVVFNECADSPDANLQMIAQAAWNGSYAELAI